MTTCTDCTDGVDQRGNVCTHCAGDAGLTAPGAPTTVFGVSFGTLLNSGEWLPTSQTHGIGAVHTLFVNQFDDGNRAVYAVMPEGGRLGSPATIRSWLSRVQYLPAWEMPDDGSLAAFEAQVAAEQWVAEQAHNEVRAEYAS